MQNKKRDLILVGIILILAAAGFLINHQLHRQPAAQLRITVDGVETAVYDLSKDQDLIIEGYHGGTNHLIISEGTARISEASCPDKVCVHQGRISENGQVIVCLPNRMVAKIISPEE